MNRMVHLMAFTALALGTSALAQSVPQSMKIQGYLSDRSGGPPVPANGSYNMVFEIFAAPNGGAALATVGPLAVTVTNGVYDASIPTAASVFTGAARYLQVTVNGEVLSPRLSIDSVPYSLRAESAVNAETVAPGSVGPAQLADGSVTAAKIGIPCAEGQTLVRSGEAWTCATLAAQVCPAGAYVNCYPGPPGTAGNGPCRTGVSTCKPDGSGFDACIGAVTPATEICDAVDNDCDGPIDELPCAQPVVTTLPPTAVTSSSATLNGTANPNGLETTGWFRYATHSGSCNDSFGTRVPASGGVALGSGTSAVAYSQSISGLNPNDEYYYCAFASNSAGTRVGSQRSFTTVLQPPTVNTIFADVVTANTALLTGRADPNGNAATGWFRVSNTNPGGCNDSFGTRVPSSGGVAVGSGTTGVDYSYQASGLVNGTTNYFCAIASNVDGTRFGALVSFTTRLTSPTVTTSAATSVTSSSATLNGSGNPNGTAAWGFFRYSTSDPGFCNSTFGTRAPGSIGTAFGSGTNTVAYSESITGLSPGTTYYFCALAYTFDAVAAGAGSVMSFTTP